MNTNEKLQNQLISLILQGNAFMPLTNLLESIPLEITAKRIDNPVHTIWELTEHIRIALYDLVAYSKDSYFQSPPWPDGYWPDHPEPQSSEEWGKSINQINSLLNELTELIKDPSVNLYEPFKANPEHTLLRQITIVAEHNAYHTGQIAMLKNLLQGRDQQ